MGVKTTHYAMGTIMTHKTCGLDNEDGLTSVCREIDRIEKLFSRFSPESEIYRVNRSAGTKSEKVSVDTYAVLSEAVKFSRYYPGCFDVTIEPLVTLWNTGKKSFLTPDKESIDKILPLINYRDVILDPRKKTAGLRQVGQAIDLGGIGKGFAGDKIREIYNELGITSAYSNLGGNVVTLGAKPDGSPWNIGIQHPRQEKKLIGSVTVVNQAVVTSGDYQRYTTDDCGKHHHHILDPSTGYPSESGLISVSIVTEESLKADVLATMVFIAGKEKGLEILSNFPQTGAILVDTDMRIYVTQDLKYRFQAEKDMDLTILY